MKEQISDDLWKIQYEAKQKTYRRNYKIGVVATIIIAGLFSSIVYLSFTDGFKFLGHDTSHITATVSEIKWYHAQGDLTQMVIYKFQYEGSDYTGYFKGTKFTFKHKVGDLVKVQFATDDPSISKRIATLKRKD